MHEVCIKIIANFFRVFIIIVLSMVAIDIVDAMYYYLKRKNKK
jgi:hypothetical protein